MSYIHVVFHIILSPNCLQDLKAIGIKKNGFLLRLHAAIKQLPTTLVESRMPVSLIILHPMHKYNIRHRQCTEYIVGFMRSLYIRCYNYVAKVPQAWCYKHAVYCKPLGLIPYVIQALYVYYRHCVLQAL